MKKFITVVINAICIIMIIAAILLLGSVVLNKDKEQPSIFGFTLYRVLTASMEPKIPVNSIVVVKATNAFDIEVGDIITFRSEDPSLQGQTNTHRVIAIDYSTKSPVFTTKGDNSLAEDRYPVTANDLIGKVVYISGIVGIVMALISNPILFALVIIIPLAIIFLINVKDLIKSAKNLEVYEIMEAIEESGNDKTPIPFDDSEEIDESGTQAVPGDADPIQFEEAAPEDSTPIPDASPIIDDTTPIQWSNEEEK